MEMSRKTSETRRKNTLKCDESVENVDAFQAKTDRSTLLGEYNSQMLKCKYTWGFSLVMTSY
jgi:hypothetical protein